MGDVSLDMGTGGGRQPLLLPSPRSAAAEDGEAPVGLKARFPFLSAERDRGESSAEAAAPLFDDAA